MLALCKHDPEAKSNVHSRSPALLVAPVPDLSKSFPAASAVEDPRGYATIVRRANTTTQVPHTRCILAPHIVVTMKPLLGGDEPAMQGGTSRKPMPAPAHRLPGQLVECGWCGTKVPVPSRGRVPKWCSATCRNRGWQATHAPSRGPVRVVQQRVQVPVPLTEPRNIEGWVQLLDLLTTRLAQGRIYSRDLPAFIPAVNRLIEVTERRLRER